MFKHSPLSSAQNQIRLVEVLPDSPACSIRCKVREVPLDQADYFALFYEWGSSDHANLRLIELNAKSFHVTSNLHAFLATVRNKAVTKSFWIDAICIDQLNSMERSIEVKRMGKIFSVAREVWVWLGATLPDSPMAIMDVFDLSQQTRLKHIHERVRVKIERFRDAGNQDWVHIIQSICSNTYWNRLWIVQEFLVARSVVVLLGEAMIEGELFSAMIALSGDSKYLYPPQSIRKAISKSSAWELCKTRHSTLEMQRLSGNNQDLGQIGHQRRPLLDILGKYACAQCADWHDKVYGLLSLTEGEMTSPLATRLIR